jgi:hypothetical protein
MRLQLPRLNADQHVLLVLAATVITLGSSLALTK